MLRGKKSVQPSSSTGAKCNSGGLLPSEYAWSGAFDTLQARFKYLPQAQIAQALRSSDGHAGKAAAILRGTGQDSAASQTEAAAQASTSGKASQASANTDTTPQQRGVVRADRTALPGHQDQAVIARIEAAADRAKAVRRRGDQDDSAAAADIAAGHADHGRGGGLAGFVDLEQERPRVASQRSVSPSPLSMSSPLEKDTEVRTANSWFEEADAKRKGNITQEEVGRLQKELLAEQALRRTAETDLARARTDRDAAERAHEDEVSRLRDELERGRAAPPGNDKQGIGAEVTILEKQLEAAAREILRLKDELRTEQVEHQALRSDAAATKEQCDILLDAVRKEAAACRKSLESVREDAATSRTQLLAELELSSRDAASAHQHMVEQLEISHDETRRHREDLDAHVAAAASPAAAALLSACAKEAQKESSPRATRALDSRDRSERLRTRLGSFEQTGRSTSADISVSHVVKVRFSDRVAASLPPRTKAERTHDYLHPPERAPEIQSGEFGQEWESPELAYTGEYHGSFDFDKRMVAREGEYRRMGEQFQDWKTIMSAGRSDAFFGAKSFNTRTTMASRGLGKEREIRGSQSPTKSPEFRRSCSPEFRCQAAPSYPEPLEPLSSSSRISALLHPTSAYLAVPRRLLSKPGVGATSVSRPLSGAGATGDGGNWRARWLELMA